MLTRGDVSEAGPDREEGGLMAEEPQPALAWVPRNPRVMRICTDRL